MIVRVVIVMILMSLSSFSYGDGSGRPEKKNIDAKKESAMKIHSPAFEEEQSIPIRFTCDSTDISPELRFEEVPPETRSLALICDDPDAPAGTWVHWVIFNIPVGVDTLPENVSPEIDPDFGGDSTVTAVNGKNDFGRFGYGGPCPPPGPAHRYYFKLYALDGELEFPAEEIKKGITKEALLKKMEGHILAETSLMGKYKR